MVALLPEALKTHVRLHMLFLDNNKITVAGAKAVSSCLTNKQELSVLNLDNNKMSAEGAQLLAAQL